MEIDKLRCGSQWTCPGVTEDAGVGAGICLSSAPALVCIFFRVVGLWKAADGQGCWGGRASGFLGSPHTSWASGAQGKLLLCQTSPCRPQLHPGDLGSGSPYQFQTAQRVCLQPHVCQGCPEPWSLSAKDRRPGPWGRKMCKLKACRLEGVLCGAL